MDPDPKLGGKWDPDPKLGGKWDPDPKKIVTYPQHWDPEPIGIHDLC
jgi:hypothetical protein